MERRLFNAWGIARRLQLPVDWIRREAKAGRIPHLKIGCRLRFDIDAVETSLIDRIRDTAPKDAED